MTFLTESWFWRGTQSAIFYYVSCAPCTTFNSQRKKKRDAKRAPSERDAAGTFQHPLASSTNPGWNEEIGLGPGPPPKRISKKEMRRRDRLKMKIAETIDLEATSASVDGRMGTGTSSVGTLDGKPLSQSLSQKNENSWNRHRYQREDEILWGRNDVQGALSLKGFSPISGTASGAGGHYYARNPEVNDLHPPVVSAYTTSKAEIQWMLQPPPKARVMAGKESPNRSRSTSGTSGSSSVASRGSSRRGKGKDLGRSMGARLMEGKVARGEGPPPAMSANSLSISRGGSNPTVASSPSGSMGQRQERDLSIHKDSKDLLAPISSADRARPQSPDCHDLARPHLPTIPSASYTGLVQSPRRSPAVSSPPPLPLLVTTDTSSSLQTLQVPTPLSDDTKKKDTSSSSDVAKSVKLLPTPLEEKKEPEALTVDDWEPPPVKNGGEWGLPLPTGHRWGIDI